MSLNTTDPLREHISFTCHGTQTGRINMSSPNISELPIVVCPYCRHRAKLVTGEIIYPHRPDLSRLLFWQCSPCFAYVGTHKNSNGVPLGRLANNGLRKMKQKAHATFDPIWKRGELSRGQAYAILADKMSLPINKTHFGMFTEQQCQQAIDICSIGL